MPMSEYVAIRGEDEEAHMIGHDCNDAYAIDTIHAEGSGGAEMKKAKGDGSE